MPVAVGLSDNNDDAHQAPGGVDLTAAEVTGRSVFAQKCSTCHTLAASNAVGRVGPNLDNLRPPKGLVLDAIKNGRARGQGQMPAGLDRRLRTPRTSPPTSPPPPVTARPVRGHVPASSAERCAREPGRARKPC